MLQKVQEELETLTVEGTAGGGAVKVIVNGKQTVESVEIAPEAAEDVDLLQDLIVAAVNDASQRPTIWRHSASHPLRVAWTYPA